jgi:hypothetical protein
MRSAQSILARVATLSVMAGSVALLMHLFVDRTNVAEEFQQSNSEKFITMADAWSGEIDFSPAYAALSPHADSTKVDPASAFDPADDYWGLPRTQGFETVAAYCSACHSLQIVMAQRQSREGWDYLLHWMVEKQGMAPPAPDTREEILDYLSTAFAE